ncbi:MAG: hypothetical protein PHE61_02540 [Candidatus Omnitrophica bacterium]|nr:hypothetical protein [Candidatus Omnitrophota bacterium]
MILKRLTVIAIILAGALATTAGIASAEEKKLSPQDIKKTESSLYYDFFDKGVYDRVTQYLRLGRTWRKMKGIETLALDVNSYDEVPDSTFFTNRQGRERMTAEALRHGSCPGEVGPSAERPWTVIKGKSLGKARGFLVKDGRGNKYLLKFDTDGYPEMCTAAEVIASKFFYAIGYNVPENSIVTFTRDNLTVSEDARFYDEDGFEKKLTKESLNKMLDKIEPQPDGRYRAAASKFIEGEVLGPFSLNERREDDPDDVIVHKRRRSIRALRVFSSWLNHHDIRKGNTLDVLTTENGKTFVKHYLIDFGSTLGSDLVRPKLYESGHEYWLDWRQMGNSLATLGFYKKPWSEGPAPVEYKSVGYIDIEKFDPKKWRPLLFNFAFDDLTRADAFWATKLIMSFSDDDIRAAVKAGELSDPKAEDFLVSALAARRDKIGRAWFGDVSPLDRFRFEEDAAGYQLTFEDLALNYKLEDETGTAYRYRLEEADGKGGFKPVTDFAPLTSVSSIAFPSNQFLSQGPWRVTLQVKRPQNKDWSRPVYVTLSPSDEGSSQKKSIRISGISH